MEQKNIKVHGMHCASCEQVIAKKLGKLPGVKAASASYATETAQVSFDPQQTSFDQMNETLEPYGYRLEPQEQAAPSHAPGNTMNHEGHQMAGPATPGPSAGTENHMNHGGHEDLADQVVFGTPITGLFFLIMLWEIGNRFYPTSIPAFPVPMNIMNVVALATASIFMFWIGKPFLVAVGRFIRYGAAGMDTLVGIGTFVAYLYSALVLLFPAFGRLINAPEGLYFDVTIVVIGFIALGKYLEAHAKQRTGDAIKKLLGLQVKTALVLRGGKEQELPVDQVVLGDHVLVRPGMKIPVDGVITEGGSAIDEALLTGEPIPVDKKTGDKVSAGTINTTGSFTLKATSVGSDTLLAHIIRLVQESQGSKAPIQRLADKISSIFIPTVLVIAALTLVLWITVGSQFIPFGDALSLGIICMVGILVIACPCALGLATPTAIIVGVGKGAMNGILIKNAEALEKLHGVRALLIDKTGTLTEGKPTVVAFTATSMAQDEALAVLASLERHSEHPLAQSIVHYATERKAQSLPVTHFENLPGRGVRGTVRDTNYSAGGPALLAELGIPAQATGDHRTAIFLVKEKTIVATVQIGDAIKPGAKAAVQTLKQMGVRIIMATGDHEGAAKHVATELGITEYIAQALPADKLAKVKALQAQGLVVAVAGDGVNDAPALAGADVSIAMSTGTDVSIEASDITLLRGDITKISQAIRLSRLTMRTIKQNLFWAFAYNVIGIPLAAGVLYPVFGLLLSPIFAGMAMAFSSVSVVANSLRLKTRKL